MVKKHELVHKIKHAFKNVKLEDGIGLWEAQGHDDRLSETECKKLRRKDELLDWNTISIKSMYECSSSLSFFDAKGLHFHIPKYLLLALGVYKNEEEDLINQEIISMSDTPDIDDFLLSFTTICKETTDIEYRRFHKERFSLFTNEQLKCLVMYLEYKKIELEDYYKTDKAKELGLLPMSVQYDTDYIKLNEAIECWIKEFQIR
ncbi:DUF6714 family protein [Aquimarina sp. 433]